jgi:hypothetical protein
MEHLLVSSDIPDNCLPNSKVLLHVKKKKNERNSQIWFLSEPHDAEISLVMTVVQLDN